MFNTIKVLTQFMLLGMIILYPNLFAVVVMAHIKAQATRRKAQERLRWKINLVKGLYQRGYKRKDIYELLRFIDWIMALSPRMERGFWQEVHKIEEAGKMRYVMSIERIAMEDGLEQGLEQGSLKTARENLIDILNLRFQSAPQELVNAINALTSLDQLKMLLRRAITTGTLEEFEQFVESELK